jgi:hypothetical protein
VAIGAFKNESDPTGEDNSELDDPDQVIVISESEPEPEDE